MPAMDDDDRPKKKIVHEIGQDLALLSINELEERIAVLIDEIARLQAAIASSAMQVRCVRSLTNRNRAPRNRPGESQMRSVRMNLSRGVFPDKPPADLTRDGRAPLTWVY